MKKIIRNVVFASSLSAVYLYAIPYTIDNSHSYINFKISHMIVSNVDGNFSKFSGKVDIDEKSKMLNNIEGEIDILSINTRSEERDGHLLGDAYFDAGTYPKGLLKATKISRTRQGIKIETDLTLKGITKKVVFMGELKGPVQNPIIKKDIFGLSLKATINRKDFNIGKETSSSSMGEDVEIYINLELIPE